MTAGQTWPAEWETYEDWVSGARVRRLTNHKGHSHHLYFTNPGWYDDGRRLLFGSDRDNRTNLFSIELATGEITQVTDFDSTPGRPQPRVQTTTVNPTRAEAYLWHGPVLTAIDLTTFETRPLWEGPNGFRQSMINCTADGQYVCAGVFEDVTARLGIEPGRFSYAGFPETFEAHPDSRIYKIATDGSGADLVWQEQCWIGHVNTSPTQPTILTFCHEGPWDRVDNRIWGLDITDGTPWMIRAREHETERVGHEYWYADGVRIGYHGVHPDGTAFLGRIRYDNSERVEADFSHWTGHIHSNDEACIAGDGGEVIRLWQWTGSTYEGPRVLAVHKSSMVIQQVHPHPRFTPDGPQNEAAGGGAQVLFTSDRTGYGNLYLADVPAFERLPMADET